MLDEPPEYPGDQVYLRAFHVLSTCRPGEAVGARIPWVHIIEYADRSGFEPDVAEMFVDVIMHLDVVYQDWLAERAKQNRDTLGIGTPEQAAPHGKRPPRKRRSR